MPCSLVVAGPDPPLRRCVSSRQRRCKHFCRSLFCPPNFVLSLQLWMKDRSHLMALLPAIPATAAVVILEAAGTVAAENPVSDSLPSFPASGSTRGRGRGTCGRGSFLHTDPFVCGTLVCAVPAPSPRLCCGFRSFSWLLLHIHDICLAFC